MADPSKHLHPRPVPTTRRVRSVPSPAAPGTLADRLEALERVLHGAHIGTFDWDLESGTVAYSDNAPAIFGLASLPQDRAGLAASLHPADREPVRQCLEELLRPGATESDLQLEYRVEGEDGRVRWIRGEGRIHRRRGGRPARVAGTVRDVSDRKELETQLLQSQKMESIGRLAGGVAHDFNNLLTAIFGELELARDAVEPRSELGESLEGITQAADRARRLTAQLLAFARQQVFELQVTDLGELLHALSDLLERALGEDVRLRIDVAPGLWPARVDPHQLEQVVLNLAVNGREAMAQGGTLTLEASNRADGECPVPGDHVLLSVRDTGAGMAEAVRVRAPEPFFTTKEVGTGLGLSTCYGIVEQLGGHLALSSELGRGTEARVYLPRLRAPGEETEAPHTSDRENATVLVVEDEAAVRAMTARGLRKHGYAVIEAVHGAEALNRLREGRRTVDVLVTDVVMPGLSGRDLAERARALSPETLVLFVSGHGEEVIGHHGVDGVADTFLRKPYTPAQLARRIGDLLARDDGRGEANAEGVAR